MLMRTTAMVIAAIRRNRETVAVTDFGERRNVALARFADLELVRVVAREDDVSSTPASADTSARERQQPEMDREVQLRVVHADGGPHRTGRALAARLRDRDPATRLNAPNAYLRPMSHAPDLRRQR